MHLKTKIAEAESLESPQAVKQHIFDAYNLQLKSVDTLKKMFTSPDIESEN